MQSHIKLTLLGSGDTLGTPVPGSAIGAQYTDRTSRRYRFGILLEVEGYTLLIDTNPDIKRQALEFGFDLRDIDTILLTHTHSDHINGMGEFWKRRETPTTVYHGDHPLTLKHIDYFRYLEREEVMSFHEYSTGNSFTLTTPQGADISVLPVELNHGFPTRGFVITIGDKKISIASDTNRFLHADTIAAMAGSDILFLDAFAENREQVIQLYTECNDAVPEPLDEHRYHMNIDHAKELHTQLDIKKTITVHMSRFMQSHNGLVKEWQDESFEIGYDGMEVVM